MWIINIWLYLCFIFSPPQYILLREAGAPCMVYLPDAGEQPATPPPPCFYNPE